MMGRSTCIHDRRQSRQSDPLGRLTTFAYGVDNRTAIYDGIGRWTFTYDRLNLTETATVRQQVSQSRKGPSLWLPSLYHYDALGSTRIRPPGYLGDYPGTERED
jgi:hypothetical protein